MWSPSTSWEDIQASSTISTNQWYHFAGTYDGTTQKFYLNGVLVGSRTSTISYTALDSVLIGADKGTVNGTLTDFWQGSIDEVRIYNYALTATEITSLYKTTAIIPSNRSAVCLSNKLSIRQNDNKVIFYLQPDIAKKSEIRISTLAGKMVALLPGTANCDLEL